MNEEALTDIIAALDLANKALHTMNEQLTKLENKVEDLADNTATDPHYHDEYASIDHVERSENSFNSQLYSIKNDISNLEYRVGDAESKIRQTRSGW